MNITTIQNKNQSIGFNSLYFPTVLKDVSASGRVRPWRDKKIMNNALSQIYLAVDEAKAERLSACANFLGYTSVGDKKTLTSANFCRVRLCPICQWRRSLKLYSQVSKIFSAIELDKPGLKYIFVTLTVPNVQAQALNDTINSMMIAWNKFTKYKDFSARVKGFYRGMEITHNIFNNTFHPHFHCVFAVNSSYFNSKIYYKQSDWTNLWSKASGVQNPIVDVRRIKGDPAKAVAEVVKYTVKEADYIFPYDYDKSVEIVALLNTVLNNRRFVSFGGILKEYHKKLNLDDVDDGDLLHVDDLTLSVDEKTTECFYVWNTGYRQYFAE